MQPHPSSALRLKPQNLEAAIEAVGKVIYEALQREDVWDEISEVGEELTFQVFKDWTNEAEEFDSWLDEFLVTQALLTYQGGDPRGNQGP